MSLITAMADHTNIKLNEEKKKSMFDDESHCHNI